MLDSPIIFLGIEYGFADPNNVTNVLDLYYLNKNGEFVYFTTLENIRNDDYKNRKINFTNLLQKQSSPRDATLLANLKTK